MTDDEGAKPKSSGPAFAVYDLGKKGGLGILSTLVIATGTPTAIKIWSQAHPHPEPFA